jgi:DNA-binding NtrC family response regulator
MKTVLIVDDDRLVCITLQKRLQKLGYETLTASSGAEAQSLLYSLSPHIVLLDLRLPDVEDLALLHHIRRTRPTALVIMLTSHGNVKTAVQAMKAGAWDYLTKPCNLDELELTLHHAAERLDMQQEIDSLHTVLPRPEDEEFFGSSPAIYRVLQLVDVVAQTDLTVLLEGETGTGKGLVAQRIHARSSRSDGPMISVNCSAIPETLFESELFGHEKGAFTGAGGRHIGKFEQAQSGTIFLDEVNTLPYHLQSKLLSVIEERRLTRLGSKEVVQLDVRIITASNANLDAMVQAKQFRNDLYYRLKEFTIAMPSLVERKEDIPLLATTILKQEQLRLGKQINGFSSAAMQRIMAHQWPGNIRELINTIRQGILLAKTAQIEAADLQLALPAGDEAINLLQTKRNQTERELILSVLENSGNNRTQAARRLGISRAQFYRKLKKHNLD